MTLKLLRAVMCCYQQGFLLWGGDGRQGEQEEEEEEEEAVWFHREGNSLIYPRKAQRNWRRTRRTKLNQEESRLYRVKSFLLN